MRSFARQSCALLALLLFAACGLVSSGTWEDDDENWSRVFGYDKPAEIALVHSKYWRSPHWTKEFRYFLQIAPNAKLENQLFTMNRMQRLEGEDAARAMAKSKPDWFAPGAADRYEIWCYAEEPRGEFRAFLERSDRTLFLTDCQL